MKKVLLSFFVLSILITGCSSKDKSEDEQEKAVGITDAKSNEKGTTDKEQKDSSVSSEDGKEEKIASGLMGYKPTAAIMKTYQSDDGTTYTEQIIGVNDKYVQRIIKMGDMVTLQVLDWGEKEVSVVYEESNPKSSEDILNSFESAEKTQLLASVTGDEWEIINKNETVEVPYGMLRNVFVVRKTEKTGSVTQVVTSYYAPKLGLIKEIYEVQGENGYKVESVLKSVKK